MHHNYGYGTSSKQSDTPPVKMPTEVKRPQPMQQ